MEAPYDIMGIGIKDYSRFDIEATYLYNYDIWGNARHEKIWIRSYGDVGQIVNLQDSTSFHTNLTDHGYQINYISRRPDYSGSTQVWYEFEHNQGSSIIGVSFTLLGLNVSYQSSNIELKKATGTKTIF